MILKNPTKNEITVGILGTTYTIEAMGVIDVPELIGITWRKIHGFLEVVELPETPVNTILESISIPNESDAEISASTQPVIKMPSTRRRANQ